VEREDTVSKVDNIIRVLSHLSSTQGNKSEESYALKNEVDKEDEMKLTNLFEDLIVLLKDDPDNKTMIKEILNKIMNNYGHIKVISQILKYRKSFSVACI
jgi:hypothetical protein